MPPRKTVGARNLFVSSPHMSRSKAHANTSLTQHGDLKEAPAFLEVVSLGPQDGHQNRAIKMENTYKIQTNKNFRSREVEKTAESIMEQFLVDKKYDSRQCKDLSQTISARILEAIKVLGFTRYKMVAIVSIGSMKERPGMQFGSRCLWNKDTDNFISAKYSNNSLFAVAMVYGLYYD